MEPWSLPGCLEGLWLLGGVLDPKQEWVLMSEGPFPSSISVLAESSRAGNEELLFNKPLIFDAEVIGLRERGFLESFRAASKGANPKISVPCSCPCRANRGEGRGAVLHPPGLRAHCGLHPGAHGGEVRAPHTGTARGLGSCQGSGGLRG